MEQIINRVGKFSDIDTRRALGIFGKISKSNFVPFPVGSTSWRYWPEEHRALFFNVDPAYGPYEMEVHNGLFFENDLFCYRNGSCRIYFPTRRGRYGSRESRHITTEFGFSFALVPDFHINQSP
jgi:hypothetical protein